MRRVTMGMAAVVMLALACTDHEPTRPLDGPAFLISDAAHDSGKPHFYFLPPMVRPPVTTGTFDSTLAPEVQICVLDGAECEPTIAQFTMTTSWGSERLRVSPADEAYIVNWHTNEFVLDDQATYRIRVLVDGIELGFADLDVVDSGRELRNVNTNEFVPLQDGRTLPIKFRIEEGFLARIDIAPAEATIPVGETQQFTATATDLHGAALDGVAFAWSSSDGAVASVDQSGVAAGAAPGSATITASAAGVDGSAQLTVFEPTPEPGIVAPDLDASWASAVATDVNDDGIVVGYAVPVAGGTGGRRGFRWNGTDAIEFLPTGGANWCEAWGIGNRGTIVGTCFTTGVGSRGVTWTGAADPVVLPTPTALLVSSSARDVYEDDNVMRITGSVNRNYTYTCSYPPCQSAALNAAIWTSTDGLPPTGLPVQLGWNGNVNGASGVGLAINAVGYATGQTSTVIQYVCGFQCFNYIDVPHAFRYTTARGDLGANYIPPNNLGQSAGLGINAAGTIVGWTDAVSSCSSGTVCSTRHFAFYAVLGGGRTSIPGVPLPSVTNSEARDVNDLGWIVGGFAGNAFIWRQDGNPLALLDPLVVGKNVSAYAISNPKGGVLFAAGTGVTAANRTLPVRWTLVAP